MANTYINFGYPIKHILKHCGVPRSSFYYKPTFGKKGRIPYAKFYDKKGLEISSTEVLEAILTLFENKFVDYGYFKVYIYLRDELNYTVSKHYVYNLMKTNDLLQKRYLQNSKKGLRNWVTNLIPEAQKPFVYFEFDIKFIWVAGKRKNIQVLTVLDVFSRWNLGHFIAFSIKKENVIALFDEIFKTYVLPKDISVRSDNGAQFIANEVQEYFKNKGVFQEFTKPATPQQDAHIESYHSIMESAICQRFEFKDLKDTKNTLNEFREFYNCNRIHGGIGHKSPYKYLLLKGIDMMANPFKEVELCS